MADVEDWGVTESDNNVTSPDGAQSDWVGADVGPWARETMAAVARMNADPAWRNFTRYGLTPTGTKTIARTGTHQLQVTATGNWGSDTTEVFAVGRLIRVRRTTGEWVYAFIVSRFTSTTILTLNVALIGDAELTSGWTFTDNGCEFFVAMDAIDSNRAHQPLGSIAFGGAGTSAERDARFPDATSVPEGIMWANTTDNLLQIVIGTLGARTWRSIAPLSSIFADQGGDMALSSTGQSKITLNSATGNSSALILQESGATRAEVYYDAGSNRTVIEGGDMAAAAGRIYLYDSDGKAYYQGWSGGVAGALLNMTPKEIYAWPADGYRVRTGAGTSASVSVGAPFEAASGALPADVQALLESSDWDSFDLELEVVITSTFGVSTPSNGAIYTFNVYFGSGLDTTPPADLTAGYDVQFRYDHENYNPYYGVLDAVAPSVQVLTPERVRNGDLSGTIDSFFISGQLSNVGNPQNFSWDENDGGSIYSTFTFKNLTRVIS